MLNLAFLLDGTARRHPEKNALIFAEKQITYQQLNASANMVANGLVEMGVKPGDKVALSCPNIPWFPIAYFGILKAGATVVPLNVLFKGREIAYHLSDSQAVAYLCFEGSDQLPMAKEGSAGFSESDGCRDLVIITADPASSSPVDGANTLGGLMHEQSPDFETVNRDAGDTAVILYTSGTTGTPKGAELTHSNMVLNAIATAELMKVTPADVGITVLPLFHSFGQTVMMNAVIYQSGTQVLVPRFDTDAVLSAMIENGVSIFAGVPTMYWALLNHPDAAEHDRKKVSEALRLCVSGGASLPVEILHEFESAFDVPILEGYGLSETSPVACFNLMDRERKPGSIGLPIWGTEMRIVDENDNEQAPGESGEVVIRGHNIMKGYFNRPAVNEEVMRGGWFHSGDIGTMDEDGYFYIVDRVKDMIIRGGFNVYPREIEEVLLTHPAISLAAVIGVPNDEYGEEIKAFVILKEGVDVTEAEIVSWSKDTMAAYKYPRTVEIRDALPMTATGKILKRELRAE